MATQQCDIKWQTYILYAAVFSIGFIAFLLIIVFIKRVCSKRQKWSDGNLASYGEKWKRIEYLSNKEDTRPLAIIYACSLLDQVLMTNGYLGETFHDRLASAHIALGNNQISRVWGVRNQLAHDTDMKPLDKKKTKQNLKIIRQALFDLNMTV
jgi:hypothetical protein